MMTNLISCGEDWMDCPYFDPDVCLQGDCVIADSLFWEDEGYYNEDDTPEYGFVYYE